MKKIPTIFLRDPENLKLVLTEPNPACAWVFAGEGVATRKYDGTCVLLDEEGLWWARREVKPGKLWPDAYQAVETDPVTGKTVGWGPIESSPFARYHAEALGNAEDCDCSGDHWKPGTYELVGPKVNGNPERYDVHALIPHASAERVRLFSLTFDGIRDTVRALADREGYEGLVWHHPDGRMAKVKARDFVQAERGVSR